MISLCDMLKLEQERILSVFFVEQKKEKQITLSEKTYATLRTTIISTCLEPTVFDDAQKAVQSHMDKVYVPLFLSSKQFKKAGKPTISIIKAVIECMVWFANIYHHTHTQTRFSKSEEKPFVQWATQHMLGREEEDCQRYHSRKGNVQ